jgi:hypothetical protein
MVHRIGRISCFSPKKSANIYAAANCIGILPKASVNHVVEEASKIDEI